MVTGDGHFSFFLPIYVLYIQLFYVCATYVIILDLNNIDAIFQIE